MERKRRSFSREFKAEAVRLITEGGRPLSHVARELDVRPELLRAWRKRLEEDGVISPVRQSEEDELRRLRRENSTLRMERDFLKKAAAFFAKGST